MITMLRRLTILAALAAPGAGQDDGQIQKWIEQLGSDSIEVRDKAEGALVAAGERALPALRKVLTDSSDAEVRLRAQHALETIEWPIAWSKQPSPFVLDLGNNVKMTFVRIRRGSSRWGTRRSGTQRRTR